jgi:hypothetical protein
VNHSGGAFEPRDKVNGRTQLPVADSLVQNLPGEAAKPMGNYPDGLLCPRGTT